LAVSLAIAAPALAQVGLAVPDTAIPPAPNPTAGGKVVEGATPRLVAQVDRCQGHKFESQIEIDPETKRSTKVKLCANPGSSDADWVKTLRAAIVQIEARDMPPAAKDKLIAELEVEVSRFVPQSKPLAIAQAPSVLFAGNGADGGLIAPAERFETSITPPLPAPKVTAKGASGAKTPPRERMGIRIKCLSRGESGSGSTCDFFDSGTVLAVSAVEGLDKGGRLRFLRRGAPRAETALAPLHVGQSVRVKLPGELCRGVSYSKVEIELLGPDASGVAAARLGPYGLRC